MLQLEVVKCPKYKRVSKCIRSEIESGFYGRGQMLPSHDKLMKTYKVSLGTIRQSLSELSKEGILKIEHGRGTFVYDIDHKHKEGVDAGETRGANSGIQKKNVGYVIWSPNISLRLNDPLDMLTFYGAYDYLQQYNKDVVFSMLDMDRKNREQMLLDFCGRLESLIIVNKEVEAGSSNLLKHLHSEQRVVVIDEMGNIKNNDLYSSVFSDIKAHCSLAVQTLIAYGHKNIRMITRRTGAYEKVFMEVCREMGIEDSGTLNVLSPEDEYSVVQEVIEQKKLTAIVVLGDHFSCRLLNILNKSGCKVPEDKSLISIGGVAREDMGGYELFRINSNFEEIGREAAKLLFRDSIIQKPVLCKIEPGSTLSWPKGR